LVKIDVCVTERTTGYSITTDADGGDGSNCVEYLEEKSLVYVREKVSYVERSILEGSSSGIGRTRVSSFRGSGVSGHFVG